MWLKLHLVRSNFSFLHFMYFCNNNYVGDLSSIIHSAFSVWALRHFMILGNLMKICISSHEFLNSSSEVSLSWLLSRMDCARHFTVHWLCRHSILWFQNCRQVLEEKTSRQFNSLCTDFHVPLLSFFCCFFCAIFMFFDVIVSRDFHESSFLDLTTSWKINIILRHCPTLQGYQLSSHLVDPAPWQ